MRSAVLFGKTLKILGKASPMKTGRKLDGNGNTVLVSWKGHGKKGVEVILVLALTRIFVITFRQMLRHLIFFKLVILSLEFNGRQCLKAQLRRCLRHY